MVWGSIVLIVEGEIQGTLKMIVPFSTTHGATIDIWAAASGEPGVGMVYYRTAGLPRSPDIGVQNLVVRTIFWARIVSGV